MNVFKNTNTLPQWYDCMSTSSAMHWGVKLCITKIHYEIYLVFTNSLTIRKYMWFHRWKSSSSELLKTRSDNSRNFCHWSGLPPYLTSSTACSCLGSDCLDLNGVKNTQIQLISLEQPAVTLPCQSRPVPLNVIRSYLTHVLASIIRQYQLL